MTTQPKDFVFDTASTTFAETVRHVVRTLQLIWQSSPRWSIFNMLMIIVRGAVPLLMLWAIMLLVDTTVEQVSAKAFDFSQTLGALAIVGAFLVLNPLAASVHSYVKDHHSFCLQLYVSSRLQAKTTTIDYQYFEDAAYQDIFYRTINDSLSRPQAVFYDIVGVLQCLLTIGIMSVVLLTVHPAVPFVIVLIGLPILAMRIRTSRRLFELLRAQTEEERRVIYYDRVLTSRDFAKEIRIFGLGQHFRRLYRAATTDLHTTRQRIVRRYIVREALTQIVVSILTVGVFGGVVYMASVGAMTVGALAMYFMTMHRCYATATEALQHIASLYESNLFLKNFYIFIDMPTGNARATAHFPKPMQQGISVEHVSFKYANTTRTVLSDVSFSIAPGETVAILGANGSGKSTLIKILCGLYKPTSGSVCVDGIPLTDIQAASFQENVSAIFQDFMLYNASAADNIRFGNLRAEATEETIRAAARNAGIDELFANLRHGYQTPIGFLTPDSEMLSRGEWQRTALARSFYNDAQIIVLDEPTSSLDIFTEAQLVSNFRQITRNRTSIIVSHRLSTIRLADRIIMLRDKGIAEQGSFEELMARRGYFYQMIKELEM